ncbi:hypothetical protein CHS0354_008446 [Potamilus streckersoni]|uniref:Antistasin-like domain-containing protein n=1 Tax=Potamilus streckersoni TaxID=2493646 RepID=A0AAE0VGF9_9BIVA|nr:hypothetical protein CHS0354_008446 [Potamilus streckersoni]
MRNLPSPRYHFEHTTPPSEMSKEDACAVAHTKCQLNCPYGFMTDSDHCDICICKDDIYAFGTNNISNLQKEKEVLN